MSERLPLRPARGSRASLVTRTVLAGLAVLSALAVVGAAPAAAQTGAAGTPVFRGGPGPRAPGDDATVRLMVFAFRHQRASEALASVRALLSDSGSVALDEGRNTLSVRDTAAHLARIARTVQAIDHATRELRIEVQLIRADSSQVSPKPPTSGIAPELLGRLRTLFRYDAYTLLSRSALDTRENEHVDYEMGEGLRLSFRTGTALGGRLRLGEFEIARTPARQPARVLVRTAVNLHAQQPLLLGLTSDEAARRALLVALRYETLEVAVPPAVPSAARSAALTPGG